jgi:lysophospholipase L1-like esterase
MDEILCENPDAILIYTGHNEYYGALGVASLESAGRYRGLVLTFMQLNNFKTFILLRSIIARTMDFSRQFFFERDINLYGTLMERLAKEQQIPVNSSLFKKGKEQFEENIRAIFFKARNAGVPVLISELVCNIREIRPFIAVETDSLSAAMQVFLQAQIFEENQQYGLAKEAYYKSKDLDAIHFRAQASPNGLIGSNLMIDHLHPNTNGYFLMAEAFYQTMREHYFIADQWDSLYILPEDEYRENWPITDLDSTVAELLVRQLKGGWPFKSRFTENRTLLDYQPRSMIESLALQVIYDEISIDKAHFVLAQHFDKINEHQRATREYDAITCLVFIEAYSYLNRAKAFLRANKYAQALEMLQESLKREKIPLAYRLAGEIYLRAGESENAIWFFEKARAEVTHNREVLYGLCLAYKQSGKMDEARQVFEQFNNHFPDDPRIMKLEQVLSTYAY